MRLKLLAKFALRDLVYDRKVSFFVIAALVAVIAPLLLLFSLKYGVVSQLQNQLLNDPQNLEIKINGMQSNKVLDKAWFTRLQQHDSVQFVIPLTRSLNMQGDLRKDNQRFLNNVELIPTDKGDPLIPSDLSLPDKTSVILTALSAEKLQVKPGETVTLFFGRKLDGNEEREKVELTVAGVLDERYFQRVGAFISLELLIEIEDYRDGFQITKFVSAPTTGKPMTHSRDIFAKARIYAKQLDDVAPLALALREEGIDTQTQANAIENVKAIDRVLGTIFTIVAATSIIACCRYRVHFWLISNVNAKIFHCLVCLVLNVMKLKYMWLFRQLRWLLCRLFLLVCSFCVVAWQLITFWVQIWPKTVLSACCNRGIL